MMKTNSRKKLSLKRKNDLIKSKQLTKKTKTEELTQSAKKRVRFAKEQQTKLFSNESDNDLEDSLINGQDNQDGESEEDFDTFDDEDGYIDYDLGENEIDDEDKEFLKHTMQGKSYPVVKEKLYSDDDDDDDDEDGEKLFNLPINELKEKDPEFYQYLLDHDKDLLDDKDDDNDDENVDVKQFDDKKITRKLINTLSAELKTSKDRTLIVQVIHLFKKCVDKTRESNSKEDDVDFESVDILNSIIHMCIIDLIPAVYRHLRLKSPAITAKDNEDEFNSINLAKCKNWKRLLSPMKIYCTTLLQLLDTISESSVHVTILRHILHLIPFFNCYIILIKKLLKITIKLWSESEEKVRVLAFLIIIRLMRNQPQKMLSFILKKLYMTYVKNCRFTNKKTWPLIIFMRQSLVELYSLDISTAYNHAFILMRQCGITLRNAIVNNKESLCRSVYNWQYVHSLMLWSNLLVTLHQNDLIKSLIHPLVQVIIGSIRLIPSAKNFPLRFHLIKTLIHLSESTNVYIPLLAHITEVLKIVKTNNKTVGNKKFDLDCVLKVSKNDCSDAKYADKCIEKVYELLLEYLTTQSNSIAFPELVLQTVIQLKEFMKKCKNIVSNRLLKQCLDKIQENVNYIEQERKKVTFAVTDFDSINEWEMEMKEKPTPIKTFYLQWMKVKIEKEKREMLEEERKEALKRQRDEEDNSDFDEENDDQLDENENFEEDEQDDDKEEKVVVKVEKKNKKKRKGNKQKTKKMKKVKNENDSFAIDVKNLEMSSDEDEKDDKLK